MNSQDLLTCLGMLLTLFGLLISLFSIHLGTWIGQLSVLRTKWDINFGSRDERISARREVKYELKGLYTHVPFLLTAVVWSFALSVVIFAHCHWSIIESQVPNGFASLFFGFFVVMLVLTAYLLFRGASIGRYIKNQIAEEQKSTDAGEQQACV